uniref:Uncharacterized protein n=1 Tax=Daucus carota subsp. sativus TaxID=79200 RepID=A0A175YKR6_DAUCS
MPPTPSITTTSISISTSTSIISLTTQPPHLHLHQAHLNRRFNLLQIRSYFFLHLDSTSKAEPPLFRQRSNPLLQAAQTSATIIFPPSPPSPPPSPPLSPPSESKT